MRQIELDISKFVIKCNSNDCEENELNVCCCVCDKLSECIIKNWTCVNLDDEYKPYGCSKVMIVSPM